MNTRRKRLTARDLIDLRDGDAEIRKFALKADTAFNEECYEAAHELYSKLGKLPKVMGQNWQIYSQIGILHSKFRFQTGDMDAVEVEATAIKKKIEELSIRPTGWLADCLKQANDLLGEIKEKKKKKRKRTELDEPEVMQAEVVEFEAVVAEELEEMNNEEMTENPHPPKRQKIDAASNTAMIYIAIEISPRAQSAIKYKKASGQPKPNNEIVNKLVELVQKADKRIEDDEPLEAFHYINNAYALMYKNKECFNGNRGQSWYRKKIKWIAERCELAVSLMSDIGKAETYIEKYAKLDREFVKEWSEAAMNIANCLLNNEYSYEFVMVIDELKGKLGIDNVGDREAPTTSQSNTARPTI